MIKLTLISRTIGTKQTLAPFIIIFIATLIIFALKKPNAPGEDNEKKSIQKFVGIGVLVGTLLLSVVLAEKIGIINNDIAKILPYSVIEGTINFSIPLAYVSSVPNMKEYVLNTITDILDCIISKVAFAFADTVNHIYNLAIALKPSARIYPTIE